MKAADWPFSACPIAYPAREWRCQVVAASDADTFVLLIDEGWHGMRLRDVRLLGIDTYERRTGTAEHRALGKAAYEFAVERYVGRWALLETRMDDDKYGRVLGRLLVLNPEGGLHDVAAEMRAAGFEKPRDPTR